LDDLFELLSTTCVWVLVLYTCQTLIQGVSKQKKKQNFFRTLVRLFRHDSYKCRTPTRVGHLEVFMFHICSDDNCLCSWFMTWKYIFLQLHMKDGDIIDTTFRYGANINLKIKGQVRSFFQFVGLWSNVGSSCLFNSGSISFCVAIFLLSDVWILCMNC
jgi:hypothetical protein